MAIKTTARFHLTLKWTKKELKGHSVWTSDLAFSNIFFTIEEHQNISFLYCYNQDRDCYIELKEEDFKSLSEAKAYAYRFVNDKLTDMIDHIEKFSEVRDFLIPGKY